MPTTEQETETDPITAALPPNTDYITYLTILEYQLTPDRLPILTKHLANDDGTLAKEIGWDLVKFILPFLDVAPKDAAKCLEVVARRGNPREVVVRVAESLETLGADDGGTGSELDQYFGTDELPTFEGEAQRIHLGEIDLQERPPSSRRKWPSSDMPTDQRQQDTSAVSDSTALQFSTLLSMLGLLHSRIKTQYPSRFLATSLPAALGAYRRIPITSETTTAFVNLLGKMSGKQRPTLPPRSSTATATHLPSATTPGTEVSAPLPDPEGQTAANAEAPSDLEMSIVLRLLQAVTLEVLEEHILADPSTMEWSTRLLDKRVPGKAMPDRKSRSKAWQEDENLQTRDGMMAKFLRLAKDLRMSPENIFRRTNLPLLHDSSPEDEMRDTSAEEDEDEDEEPSDFPASPSQIPYSHLGALFLFLASKVPAIVYSNETVPPMVIPTPDLLHFVNQFVVPTPTFLPDLLIPSVAHNPTPAIDALLSLLLLTQSPQNWTVSTSEPTADADYKSLISIFTYLSAEHPSPSIRTSAHHLATTLLHNHPSSTFRVTTIKSTLVDCGPFNNLKEVAINWLKEEILFTIPVPMSTSSISGSTQRPSSNDKDNIFAAPTLFSDDETLGSLIFPSPPRPAAAPASDKPQPSSPPTIPIDSPQLAIAIPSLNLLFLLLTNPTLKSRYNLTSKLTTTRSSPLTTTKSTTNDTTTITFESRALSFLTSMQQYLDENAGKGSKEEEGKLGFLGLAVGRVLGALDGYRRDIERDARERGEAEHR